MEMVRFAQALICGLILSGCVSLPDPASPEGMKRQAKMDEAKVARDMLCYEALEKSLGGKTSRKLIFVVLPDGGVIRCRQ